jgi:uncharacterized membrane-anchored protein YhcB (DUF1043 family)
MKQSTKYQYEKRIKELQEELNTTKAHLYNYKELTREIFNVLTEMVQTSKQVNQGWLLAKFKRVFM